MLRLMHNPPADNDEAAAQAFYDELSGLPNRALFRERLKHALERAERPGSPSFSVLLLDLDDFEALNARLGRAAGDELLRQIGSCLKHCLRPGDTVARLENDRFAILLETVTATPVQVNVVNRLFAALKTVQSESAITASVGVVAAQHSDAESMMHDAELALQHAKAQGKDRYMLFDSGLHEATPKPSLADHLL